MVALPSDNGSFATPQNYYSLHALPRYKLDAHVILAMRNDVPELAHLVELREKVCIQSFPLPIHLTTAPPKGMERREA